MEFYYNIEPKQTRTRRYVEGDIFGANIVKETTVRTNTRYICTTLYRLRQRMIYLNSSAVQQGNTGEYVTCNITVSRHGGLYWQIDMERTVSTYVLDG